MKIETLKDRTYRKAIAIRDAARRLRRKSPGESDAVVRLVAAFDDYKSELVLHNEWESFCSMLGWSVDCTGWDCAA